MSRIDQQLAHLTPKQLALLSRKLQRKGGADAPPRRTTIAPRTSRSERPPLSSAQERIWFLEQFQPGSPTYNLSFLIPLRAGVDGSTVERAINALVERHGALRTTFDTEDGRPVQIIHERVHIPLQYFDVNHVPEAAHPSAINEVLADHATQAFDLRKGPLLRTALLRLTPEPALAVTMHHSISDGWSNDIFRREFSRLCDAFATGVPAQLPPLAIDYADYAVWQREYLHSDSAAAALEYWREHLSDAPDHLELPFDRRPTKQRAMAGAVQYRLIPSTLAELVFARARDERATPFIVLLSAFTVLLSRYCSTDDVVIGTPIANRQHQETEGVIGFFSNTLPLRARVDQSRTFRDHLRHVRSVVLEAHKYQDYPFERLVANLLSTRDPRYSPIFQVLFAYEAQSLGADATYGGDVEQQITTSQPRPSWAKFDLTLTVLHEQQRLLCAWDYRTDVFDTETIASITRAFQVLLEQLLGDPDRPLMEANLVGQEERQRLLTQWQSPADADIGWDIGGDTLHELIAARASLTPDAVAVTHGDHAEVTYGELVATSQRVALQLRARGVEAEAMVGICMRRSACCIAAILGVLFAGATYVPLDVAYPVPRLALMIQDAEIGFILADAGGSDLAARVDCPDVEWIEFGELANGPNPGESVALPSVRPSDVAYTIFTSGSTGRPKGVMIPHAAAVNHMRWMVTTWRIQHDDAVLQRTPLSFDASVWEVFAPLCVGARLVLSESTTATVTMIPDEIARHRVTIAQLVPSLLRQLLDGGSISADSLRCLFCGGEVLDTELAQRFTRTHRAELVNLYGPTEATIDATSWPWVDGWSGPTASIGRPIAGVQVYVLDEKLDPVPPGITGELYIGGAGLARGYVGAPALTAERFVPSPFHDGQRLYRTGDRARHLQDGNIEFLGRLDQQVKIRGFRIELEEVEAALVRHPSVARAAATAVTGPDGHDLLLAHIVCPDGPPEIDELRTFLAGLVPEYLIPSVFAPRDEIPLLPSGKIDRNNLPRSRPIDLLRRAYEKPQGPTEEALAGIWERLLDMPRVGRNDDFFDLGGHSLLAVQLISRIRDDLALELPLRYLFESSTLRDLAAAIDSFRGEQDTSFTPRSDDPYSGLLEQVDELSDDEVERLLHELSNP